MAGFKQTIWFGTLAEWQKVFNLMHPSESLENTFRHLVGDRKIVPEMAT